jgi:DNA-binding SARP family transcriptional activator/tRNA A-37 threonylcarbamoyl transferase component Bud32
MRRNVGEWPSSRSPIRYQLPINPMTSRLFTFGGLRLETRGIPASGAPAQRRRLALLALLAVRGTRGMSREKAFGFLWPEQTASRARHLLSESLYVLRRLLGEDAITSTQDDLQLNEALIWSDVAAFRTALNGGDLKGAIDLYSGPFLDGFFVGDAPEFEQWTAEQRDTLSREYARALERLALEYAESGDVLPAADMWQRLSLHDPYSSRIALRTMGALTLAGDRARAVQIANSHAARVRAEVGVEPDAAVIRLAAELQKPVSQQASDTLLTLPLKTDADPEVSDELGEEFETVRVLGEGSVSRVYLAREIALRRLVAIKVLLPEHARNEISRRRFEREARAAARIHHPNVVTAYRFGHLRSGAPFIVLPYLTGGSLEDRLTAAGPLPPAQGKRHLREIADGLASAHRLGIVHRDVRPANLLYDREIDRLMLTDFGLAAVLETGSDEMRLTRPGETLGSVRYASPEQLRGDSVTERTDVYSLGIVAFELLTGRLPFDARTPAEWLIAHATTQPHPLRMFLPDADEKLEALLRRCLHKRPEQRPFANELMASL